MAIVQNPLTNRMSGNVANVRFWTWQQKNVCASIGLITDRKPQTLTDQVLLLRAKMRLIGHTMLGFSQYAKLVFPKKTPFTTAFAKVLQYFRVRLIGDIDHLILDISQLIGSSIGNGLFNPVKFQVTNTAVAALILTYD